LTVEDSSNQGRMTGEGTGAATIGALRFAHPGKTRSMSALLEGAQ
jgi:hypothetical protein